MRRALLLGVLVVLAGACREKDRSHAPEAPPRATEAVPALQAIDAGVDVDGDAGGDAGPRRAVPEREGPGLGNEP